MMINIHFNNCFDNKLIFDGSMPYLDPECKYSVALKHFNLHLNENHISRDNDLWVLSTSLVNRSPINSYQCLSYFTFKKGKLTQDYVPSSVIKYPLEIHQLQNPKFEIVRVRENKSLEIKAAFIQLEISKQCLDSANV
jgi:hypothetical protein